MELFGMSFERARKKALNIGSGFHFFTGSRYKRPNVDFARLAQDGYMQNEIVHRAVNLIASNAAQINMKVMRGDTEIDDPKHPLVKLLRRPNSRQSNYEFMFALYMFYTIGGNCFSLANTGIDDQNPYAEPLSLYNLRPDRMTHKKTKDETDVAAYVYEVTNRKKIEYEVNAEGDSNVWQFKTENPMDDFMGASPVAAAALSVDQFSEIDIHNLSVLRNGGRPSQIISLGDRDRNGNAVPIPIDQIKEAEKKFAEKLSGSNNAGNLLVTSYTTDVKEGSLVSKDMDFYRQKILAAAGIATAMGIPSLLLINDGNFTYANYQQARLSFIEETIIPTARKIISDFNEWLAPRYGDDIKIAYCWDDIPAIKEKTDPAKMFELGIFNLNETRECYEKEPVDGGDQIFMDANKFPISQIAQELPSENDKPEPTPPKA